MVGFVYKEYDSYEPRSEDLLQLLQNSFSKDLESLDWWPSVIEDGKMLLQQ